MQDWLHILVTASTGIGLRPSQKGPGQSDEAWDHKKLNVDLAGLLCAFYWRV